jgi:CRISPR-associated protein Csx14
MSDHPQVLVATLGGQPQIVTLTLDLLLRKGFPISEVIVLHPRAHASSRLHRALLRLNAEFTGGTYPLAQHPIHFHSRTLELDGQPIADITDDEHADGTLDTIHRLLGDLKRQGYRIHLSVSGGRRLMALLAISVAALNFDRHDRIWHLYTPEVLREEVDEGRLMHVPPEAGVKLIQGPFLTLGAYLSSPEQSFRRAQQEQRAQWEAQERARCAEVTSRATPAQLKVLRAFARGLRPQQVAEKLCIAPVTVNTHKTVLLNLCHNAWNVPDNERLDYHFLHAKFGDAFQNGE